MSRQRRFAWWPALLGAPVLILVLLALLWNWDWLIPFAERWASAAIGRDVTIAHLHVHLGRTIRIVADDVQIANPPGFSSREPFARAQHLTLLVRATDYLHGRRLVLPLVDVDHPVVNARQTPEGQDNYTLNLAWPPGGKAASRSAAPQIGALRIEEGQVHAVIPKLRADFQLNVSTRQAEGATSQPGEGGQLVVDAKGTYAGQPVTGRLIGGTLLSLRDRAHPYPVDLRLQNGETHLALVGSVADPLHFKGADLKLDLAGANMADLYQLTAIPLPKTSKYHITGQLGYADRKIRLENFVGQVGDSDLEGTIAEEPGARERNGKPVPVVTMALKSRRVELQDLGGLVGTEPGSKTEANATPAQRKEVAKAEATSSNLLPRQPFNMPRLSAADIHLTYEAEQIADRSVPLDNLTAKLDIINGAVSLHPFSFGVGHGRISGDVALTPQAEGQIHAKADIRFDRVDVSRLMAASHAFHGVGSIGGRAQLDAVGNSIATWAANGDGGLDLYMSGGRLSALLVDLSGLEFGSALLAALGMPQQTPVKCLAGIVALQHGVLDTRALLLDTGEAIIGGTGTIDLRTERLSFRLETKSKHFTIGSLPAPLNIGGTLKKPSILPEAKELVMRGGLAAALGILAAPLALLPTIQFGVDDPHACGTLVQESKSQAATGEVGAPVPGHKP
jgi:uncharacterized protein involved in outer membrane biogenesis